MLFILCVDFDHLFLHLVKYPTLYNSMRAKEEMLQIGAHVYFYCLTDASDPFMHKVYMVTLRETKSCFLGANRGSSPTESLVEQPPCDIGWDFLPH